MPSSPTHKNLDALIEHDTSGEYEIGGSGITQTRIYHAKHSVCVANLVYEGTLGTGSQTGYAVRSCRATPIGKEQGRLTIVWEAVSSGSGATLPPDEISVSPDNQGPRVERHPIFKPLQDQTVGDPAEYVLDVVENVVRAQDKETRSTEQDKLTSIPLALKLVKKIQQGNESFYLASLRTVWVTHTWTLPTISRGGFRQPVQGPLATYFVSDIDWLREGDDLQYSAGIWRWTRSWLGIPGQWDFDLYQS